MNIELETLNTLKKIEGNLFVQTQFAMHGKECVNYVDVELKKEVLKVFLEKNIVDLELEYVGNTEYGNIQYDVNLKGKRIGVMQENEKSRRIRYIYKTVSEVNEENYFLILREGLKFVEKSSNWDRDIEYVIKEV